MVSKKLQEKETRSKKTVRMEKLNKLLEFLMIMDRELPWEDFYAESGTELFAMFFKMTHYGDEIEHSVYN